MKNLHFKHVLQLKNTYTSWAKSPWLINKRKKSTSYRTKGLDENAFYDQNFCLRKKIVPNIFHRWRYICMAVKQIGCFVYEKRQLHKRHAQVKVFMQTMATHLPVFGDMCLDESDLTSETSQQKISFAVIESSRRCWAISFCPKSFRPIKFYYPSSRIKYHFVHFLKFCLLLIICKFLDKITL